MLELLEFTAVPLFELFVSFIFVLITGITGRYIYKMKQNSNNSNNNWIFWGFMFVMIYNLFNLLDLFFVKNIEREIIFNIGSRIILLIGIIFLVLAFRSFSRNIKKKEKKKLKTIKK